MKKDDWTDTHIILTLLGLGSLISATLRLLNGQVVEAELTLIVAVLCFGFLHIGEQLKND